MAETSLTKISFQFAIHLFRKVSPGKGKHSVKLTDDFKRNLCNVVGGFKSF